MSALKIEETHRRIHMVGVLFTREEKQLFVRAALSKGQAPATYARQLLMQAAQSELGQASA
jgi:hypothetical protein